MADGNLTLGSDETLSSSQDNQKKPDLVWEYRVPITDIYTLYDWLRLILAFIAGMSAIAAYLVATTHDPAFVFLLMGTVSLILLAMLGLSMLVVVIVSYRHGVQKIFKIGEFGIEYVGGPAIQKTADMLRAMALVGVFTGQAGSFANLAISSDMRRILMDWESIKKATVDERRHVITLHDWWHTVLRLYCDAETFKKALTLIEEHAVKTSTRTHLFK